MIQKLKLIALSLSSLFILGAPVAVVGTASAYTQAEINKCLAQGTEFKFDQTSQTCQSSTAETGTSLNTLITKIINIFSVIVGIVAVIMIIVGGFRYITSGGKQESVTGAKNTILYAIIGLIIVALAQIIVKFVLNNTAATTG